MDSAHGLFHRAIVQCSGWPDAISTDAATENAAAVLARLDIGYDLSRLTEVPTEAIVAALGAAPRNGLGPVLDGLTITTSPWRESAPALSAHVPMIVGNCRDEMATHITDPAQLDFGWAELVPLLAKLTFLSPDLLEPVVEVYRTNRPDASPGDLYIAIMSDRLREIGLRVAGQQSAQQSAVYRYDFTYEPPMEDAYLGAFHTAEGPLALRLVRYPESNELSRQMSTAWATFARTGDPNHAALPTWLPYRDNRATMTFDRESRLVHDPQPAERRAMTRLPHLGTVAPPS
jgi:para-nitrobenzyl esterase